MPVPTSKLRIILINYGALRSNSGGHVVNFANQFFRAGHIVAVCAMGDVRDPSNGLDKGVHTFTHDDIMERPSDIRTCGGEVDLTLLHVWTPREKVIRLTKKLCGDKPLPVFVHLEDNEDVIAATNLGLDVDGVAKVDPQRLPEPYPESLSHPYRYRRFLEQAEGVTTIVDRLGEFVPDNVRTMILEPGVDHKAFRNKLNEEQKQQARAMLGIDPKSRIFVYHGNMHAANQREIYSLYTAALILGRRGRNVCFIRTGEDYTDGLDLSYPRHLRDIAITLGFVDMERLIEVLSLADFYVQPGASNPFNDYRFPSKLPEFLSMGRPTILPNTNIAKRLRDGEDALFLHRGDGVEIADCVERILDNEELSRKLGHNARTFAIASLNWERNAQKLLEFYRENI